jgi:hypothetical protein
MFMVMDDVGSLIWRFARRLVVSEPEKDQEQSAKITRAAE